MGKCIVTIPNEWQSRSGRSAPDWAIKVARKELKVRSCILYWTFSTSKQYVSGMAHSPGSRVVYRYDEATRDYNWSIRITAGNKTAYEYQLWVLLHEIAHLNVGAHHGHDKVFYREALRLYKKHDLIEILATNNWVHYPTEKKLVQKAYEQMKARQAKKELVAV